LSTKGPSIPLITTWEALEQRRELPIKQDLVKEENIVYAKVSARSI
jgi:hypothetical protein